MDFERLVNVLEGSVASVSGLPLGVHLLGAAGLVAGLVLWLAGGRVVQPAFVVLGSLGGAVLGGLAGPAVLDPTVFGLPSVYAGIGGGLFAGLLLSLALFRTAMGVSAGVTFAGVGVLAAVIMLVRTPGALPELPAADEWRAAVAAQTDRLNAELAEIRGDAAGKVHVYANEARTELETRWSAMPWESRRMLLVYGGGGFVIGLLLGLAAPKKCAMLVTSMLGGATVISCGLWLLSALSPDLAARVQLGGIGWAIVWAITSILGVGVQWQNGERPKGPPAPAPA